MSESARSTSQELIARIASVRQSVMLLQSQLKSGEVEPDYWVQRLDEFGALMQQLTEEYQATDEQRRLAALYEVSRALGSSLDLDTVLNQTMDSIIQLTGAERGFLMLTDESGELKVKSARNLERETLDEEDFSVSRSVIRMVVETGEQVVTTNASKDPRFSAQSSVIVHSLRSIQCVPLKTRGEIIGVIYVDNRVKAGVFDENDLSMLTAFATQAAMAIENARLFTLTDTALAERVEELQRLQEIDQELNATLDFTETMNRTLDWAIKVTGAANGAIALIDLDAGETKTVAQVGDEPAGVTAILSGEMTNPASGHLTVPIQREGHVIGVIALDKVDKRSFDESAQGFVHRMADHAAIAIENARLYDEVHNANIAKSEFVSVMTHELRIPLTSIKGYADMLRMMGDLNEQQLGFLDIISNNVKRMSIQVSDLSDIARLESGRLQIDMEDDVSFRAVLDEVLVTLTDEAAQRGHDVIVEVADDLPLLTIDPNRLNQVLTNLLTNAYKYTPNDGTVTIKAWTDDDHLYGAVIDTGVGMSPEELAQLFTKFWRSEDRHVREQSGTGLGLTIARSILELFGGSLHIESTKGEGTTFQFELPLDYSGD